jgi:hypothetical protein
LNKDSVSVSVSVSKKLLLSLDFDGCQKNRRLGVQCPAGWLSLEAAVVVFHKVEQIDLGWFGLLKIN